MFSSLIPRKTTNGKKESVDAYKTQELYVISRYNEPHGKLEYKTFFDNISKYAENANFDKLNISSLPTYDTMKRWPDNYGWAEDYKIYEEFMNGTAQADFQKEYIKNMRTNGVPLLEIKTKIITVIHRISAMPLDMVLKYTYPMAKLTEVLTMINQLIQQDISFGSEDETAEERIPVSDTPLHEDEDLQDMWNDFFSTMVEDRE